VADAQSAAGERVEGGSVAGAVVGEHTLDLDAVPAVESGRRGRRCRNPGRKTRTSCRDSLDADDETGPLSYGTIPSLR
jgi:hypothetical protein